MRLNDEDKLIKDIENGVGLIVELHPKYVVKMRRQILRGDNNWRKMHGLPLRRFVHWMKL